MIQPENLFKQPDQQHSGEHLNYNFCNSVSAEYLIDVYFFQFHIFFILLDSISNSVKVDSLFSQI